ncbi:putative short-chain dehydrogenase reductase family protein [Eutypa lata UCREL1]|uniref:Putative short-chain dehydrogenase reductase family protein n=1 Tax=Eutypa lata (strain UCR-EL1) TaxID=1287681 RepID=M7SUU3_EUTLA|nr:putative short-chain dehydrogenase reductase family protein [Eutypa lata UCREL1]
MAQFQVNGFAIVAAGGVGKEVVFSFAEAGAKGILLADIEYEAATKAAEASKSLATDTDYRSLAIKVDVVDAQSVQRMVDLAIKEFGRIDYCINAAGVDVAEYVPFDETDPDDYDRILGINTKNMFLVCRAVAKAMKQQEPAKVTLNRHGILEKLAAVKRPLEPDEVASACLYLCSPSAVYYNGATLTLDSGILVGPTL